MILDSGEIIATYLHDDQYVIAVVRRSDGPILRLRLLTEDCNKHDGKPVKIDEPMGHPDVLLSLTDDGIAENVRILTSDKVQELCADLGMTNEEFRAWWGAPRR